MRPRCPSCSIVPAGSFERLSGAARQLLARLHPANFGAFASFVVAAMLRAAAVGQTFLKACVSPLLCRAPLAAQADAEWLHAALSGCQARHGSFWPGCTPQTLAPSPASWWQPCCVLLLWGRPSSKPACHLSSVVHL